MRFLHETREPLVDALAHRTGAGIGTCHNPNHWICRDDFEYIKNLDVDASTGFLVRIHWWKVRFLRCVSHNQRHAGADYECDPCRDPKQPTPMQRWNANQTEEGKSGKQCGSQFEDAKAAEVDHETEDAGEGAALRVTEPGSIYFYHSGRAECLHVSIDAANHHEQPKESPK